MRYTRLGRIGFVYLVPHYWSPIASSMVGLHPQVPVSHRAEYGSIWQSSRQATTC